MKLKHKHLNHRILLIAAFAGEDHVRVLLMGRLSELSEQAKQSKAKQSKDERGNIGPQ